jgi:hypothetical protein
MNKFESERSESIYHHEERSRADLIQNYKHAAERNEKIKRPVTALLWRNEAYRLEPRS